MSIRMELHSLHQTSLPLFSSSEINIKVDPSNHSNCFKKKNLTTMENKNKIKTCISSREVTPNAWSNMTQWAQDQDQATIKRHQKRIKWKTQKSNWRRYSMGPLVQILIYKIWKILKQLITNQMKIKRSFSNQLFLNTGKTLLVWLPRKRSGKLLFWWKIMVKTIIWKTSQLSAVKSIGKTESIKQKKKYMK